MTAPLSPRAKLVLLACASMLAARTLSAATFVVDSTGDEPDADLTDGICRTALGTCTLRAAIQQANALAGADTIQFNISGAGVHTISPASPLPTLTDDAGVTIDGYTQPGAKANTLAIGNDAVLLIELDGTNAGTSPSAVGITIQADSATIRGLVINRFVYDGILIHSSGTGHRIVGCFIGTDPSGTVARGNRTGIHITVVPFPTAVEIGPASGSLPPPMIGGVAPGDRNVLSGNMDGVSLYGAQDWLIQGNYIGTDSAGGASLPNQGSGVVTSFSRNVTVGGTASAAGNLISGNGFAGVELVYGGFNYVAGNQIGTNATGTVAVPNSSGVALNAEAADSITRNQISGNQRHGIFLLQCVDVGIWSNMIGTGAGGATPLGNGLNGVQVSTSSFRIAIGGFGANTIAYNGRAGVVIGIGSSDASNDNWISGNSIHDNGSLGIDLGSDGVTPNNDCDSGRGPNLFQNYPVLTSATPSGTNTRIRGSLNSAPNSLFFLDFYSNSLCDPSGYGEGEKYLGSSSVMTDPTCNGSFEVVLPIVVSAGSFLTATARDGAGNTSEFSACIPVTTGLDFYTVTPCRVVDTRNPSGAYGGPALGPSVDRSFVIAGQCGIPPDARAVAFNFTVTQPTAGGDVQLFPGGTPTPVPASVYYSSGQTRAKTTVLALGPGGDIGTHIDQQTGTADLVVDVTGYFR